MMPQVGDVFRVAKGIEDNAKISQTVAGQQCPEQLQWA